MRRGAIFLGAGLAGIVVAATAAATSKPAGATSQLYKCPYDGTTFTTLAALQNYIAEHFPNKRQVTLIKWS